jgi:hypothetical protein
MKKRHVSLAKMNQTINLSIEKKQKQKMINPWMKMEKEWDRKKAGIMPKSLLEKCAEQDVIRATTFMISDNVVPRISSIDGARVISDKQTSQVASNLDTTHKNTPKANHDKIQSTLSFTKIVTESKKRKSIEIKSVMKVQPNVNFNDELYCEMPQIIPTLKNNTMILWNEKMANLDIDFHSEITNQIRKFVQQSEIHLLLITGQHGCGKSWCINYVLKEYEKINLHDICDPDGTETNIRSALLQRGIKKKIVILEDVDEMCNHFITQFITILSKMLMPLKNEVRKNVQRVHIVPNLVIMTSVSQYDKNVRKLIQCFGVMSKNVQKISPHIQLLVCKPLMESQILKLIAKSGEMIDTKEIKNLTKCSVDCNYICSQLNLIQIEKEIPKEEEEEEEEEEQINDYSIDASSNVDIFKLCQSLLSGQNSSFEKIEKQWEKAGPMVPNMIYNSFLHFITELKVGIDVSEIYSDHDLFPNDPEIDGCAGLWEKETLCDSYQVLTQFGLGISLKNTITKRGKIDMFATEEKPTMRHNRLPMDKLETYLFMNEMSHMEQYKRLNEDVNYKETDAYKLSKIDFGRETLDSNYYYDELDELYKEPTLKKKRNFEIVPIADLIKHLSHVYKM